MSKDILKVIFSVTLLITILSFFGNGIAKSGDKESGIKVLFIIASKDFRDEELKEPMKLFKEKGYKITIASSSLKTAAGMLGSKIKPDILLDDVKVKDYDAVIFVGGTGAKEYFNDDTSHRIAVNTLKGGKVLAAICIAPVILANAGLLEKKNATVWGSMSKSLKAKGAHYTGKGVQVDGNIITANGPKAARDFGEAIIKAIED